MRAVPVLDRLTSSSHVAVVYAFVCFDVSYVYPFLLVVFFSSSFSFQVQTKRRPKLAKRFKCPFCANEDTVECKMDMKAMIGSLRCRLCASNYQMPINHLHEPVDVFSEWLDDCEAAANPRESPGPTTTTAAAAAAPRYDDEDEDDDDIPEGMPQRNPATTTAAASASSKKSDSGGGGRQTYEDLGLGDSDDDDDDDE